MDISDEIPEELQNPPEERLVGTLITKRPHPTSFLMTVGVILFITLFSQLYWVDFWGLANSLPAINRNVLQQGEVWRLFTATLIHGDLGHLLSNMYMLSILGYFVYGYFGKSVFPFWTFIGAAFVNLVSISTYPLDTRLLGASGWVYLLGGFWLTSYFFIQKQFSLSSRLVRVFGIALMVFFPTSFEPTTSYRAHFIGFVVGAIFGGIHYFKNQKKIRQQDRYRMYY